MTIHYKRIKTFIKTIPIIADFIHKIWITIKEAINEEKQSEIQETIEKQLDICETVEALKEKAEEQKENVNNTITQ